MANKVLIAYYSHSGNTEKVAKMISEETGGTLCPICTVNEYPAVYKDLVNQAVKEINSGYRPEIKNNGIDLSDYDTVFIGSPNWCGTVAPAVMTFLHKYDFKGKTVIPFCSHGGGGSKNSGKDVAAACPGANVLSCFEIKGSGGETGKDNISAWISGLKL